MPVVLALNPGSNSLKFDVVEVSRGQRYASDGKKLLSGSVDDIGKQTKLKLIQSGQQIAEQDGDFSDFHQATAGVLASFLESSAVKPAEIDFAAIRVVHGGSDFAGPVKFSPAVRRKIEEKEKLAPLHNASSLQIATAVQEKAPDLPIRVAFDTSFHRTLPEQAWRYPIARRLADKYAIRKYGFHGLSHRYQLERYAQLTSKPVETISVVTMHLESGSSAAAIKNGQSIDTTMGFTPLEGLMMGTRCGSIDAAIVPFLIREAGMSAERVLEILEKESGLLGISGKSLDTRILRKSDDPRSRLALEMLGYRARLTCGAYLAALGNAEAIILGGGIGENTPEVRLQICEGLQGWGLTLDANKNSTTFDGDVRISIEGSRLAAWVIRSEEGLQLAQECAQLDEK